MRVETEIANPTYKDAGEEPAKLSNEIAEHNRQRLRNDVPIAGAMAAFHEHRCSSGARAPVHGSQFRVAGGQL